METDYSDALLLDRINHIIQQKTTNQIEPSHVLFYKDLLWPGCDVKAIRVILNLLYKEGKIKVGNTINDLFITIT